MLHRPGSGTNVPTRRGMLLLLVVCILALFIMIGAVAVLLAIRARESARAFAAASASPTASAALARAQLDAALLKLIAGPSGGNGDVTESLLEDKYGTTVTACTITALASTTNAAFASTTGTATVTGLDLSNPAAIAGRILTFVPASNDPTGPTSYRIFRTGTVANTLLLANVKPTTPLPLPTVFPCTAVINGREFAGTQPTDKNEPYDAFDDQNPFLTQPVLQSSTITSVARPAFGAPDKIQVDNDGDGVPDGIWLPNVLPPQQSPDGGQLTFEVSYLVLDLDGRINLNAHGSFVRAQVAQTTAQYPQDPAGVPPVPVGMGYGPADVDAALAVGGQAAGSPTNRWALLLQGTAAVTKSATTSTTTQWRPTPPAETAQPGRYTTGTAFATAAPGSGTSTTGTNPLNADYWMVNSVTGTGNSPTDLKAQLQVFTTGGSPPTLTFARPLSAPWASGTDTTDVISTGTSTHPYALRLDEDAPRAAGTSAVDALFTVGELERILRPFDADASMLPPRLAALLDDFAQPSRMTVTTDSWDTPAITGSAAQLVASMTGTAVYNLHSPEVVAGLKFNLNRPLTSGSARQDYFRQLQALLAVLQVPPETAAQWAANVVEFRDPDSIMSSYVYASGTVWGGERPELVIVSTNTTSGQMSVGLFRPWAAVLRTGTSPTITGTTERIDAWLGNSGSNTLNLKAMDNKGSGTNAVWRLQTSDTTVGLNTLLSSATAVGTNATAGTATFSSTSSTVTLQRLADPSKALGAALDTGSGTNAYVDVGTGTANNSPGAPQFWLHWPNRDLVSHGELLAVPASPPSDIADGFRGNVKPLAVTYPAVLDATIVPSRFTGANVSVTVVSGTNFLANTGYENFQYGQFSRWREAGRVNVNTILPNTGNTATVDDVVWKALVGRSDITYPVTSGTTPAYFQADSQLLVSGTFDRTVPAAASAFLRRSTAIRLANTATVRSNVFAVWITLRITDSSPNAGTPQVARLFAIVDRSIPVGYQAGRKLNARETIRLQRFLP